MTVTHACAFAEYVEAWTALQNRPLQWLLSDQGDQAHTRYVNALVALSCAMDEDEAR